MFFPILNFAPVLLFLLLIIDNYANPLGFDGFPNAFAVSNAGVGTRAFAGAGAFPLGAFAGPGFAHAGPVFNPFHHHHHHHHSESSESSEEKVKRKRSKKDKHCNKPFAQSFATGNGIAVAMASGEESSSFSASKGGGHKKPKTFTDATGDGVAVADAVNFFGEHDHSEDGPKKSRKKKSKKSRKSPFYNPSEAAVRQMMKQMQGGSDSDESSDEGRDSEEVVNPFKMPHFPQPCADSSSEYSVSMSSTVVGNDGVPITKTYTSGKNAMASGYANNGDGSESYSYSRK